MKCCHARSIWHSGHVAEPRQLAVSRMTGGTSTQIPRRSQTIGLKTFPVSLVKELITTDPEAEESNLAPLDPKRSRHSPVSNQGWQVRGEFFVTRRNCRGPGSEG